MFWVWLLDASSATDWTRTDFCLYERRWNLVLRSTLIVWDSTMQETSCFTENKINTVRSTDFFFHIHWNLSFVFQFAIQLLSAGWSRNTTAWLVILAAEVRRSLSPRVLSFWEGSFWEGCSLGICELQLVGGKLKCTHTKYYIHTMYQCMRVYIHVCQRDRVKERLRHPTVRKKSLWAFGCSAGEDKAVWCLLTWPLIHNWGRTAVAGCTDRPQGEWQMIGPSGAELSISPNVHCPLSAYLYFL